MKRLNVLYFIVMILLLALPAVSMPLFTDADSTENRELSPFPQLRKADGSLNTGYMEEFDLWIDDHIGFRTVLAEANSILQTALFRQSSEESVIVGSDGWLFYADTEADYLNVATLSGRNIRNMVRTLEMMQNYTEKQGASFVFTVVPNKNTLYPDAMPFYYRPLSADGNLELLEQALADSDVNYVSLKSVFSEKDEILYQKQDSHWDYRGALLAYQAITGRIADRNQKSSLTFDDLSFTERKDWNADLAAMLYSHQAKPDIQYYPDYAFHYAVLSHETAPDALFLEMENENRPEESSLVMFRDSFCNAMQVFLAENYGHTILTRSYPYPMDYINTYHADTCILEIVERNLDNLVKKAPVMPAEKVKADVNAAALYGDEFTVCAAGQDGYVHIYGTIQEEYLGEDYQAYILTRHGDSVTAYEAFPIYEQELLHTDTQGDNGFSAYISESEWAEAEAYAVLIASGQNHYVSQFFFTDSIAVSP